MRVTFTILSAAALVAAAVVFWLFVTDASRLGGDAWSGHVVEGHFFVANHGRFTEVSQADWERSRTLGVLFWTTFPLGMLAFFHLLFAAILPKLIFRAPTDERDARVRAVASSGPAVASSTGGGSFRWVGVGRPMLRADVHPDGLVLRARFIGSAAVRGSEMTAVRERKTALQHAVTIEHRSPHVVSPIHLALRREAAFVEALTKLAARPA